MQEHPNRYCNSDRVIVSASIIDFARSLKVAKLATNVIRNIYWNKF